MAVELDVLEAVHAIVQHVPPKRMHLVRYYGACANRRRRDLRDARACLAGDVPEGALPGAELASDGDAPGASDAVEAQPRSTASSAASGSSTEPGSTASTGTARVPNRVRCQHDSDKSGPGPPPDERSEAARSGRFGGDFEPGSVPCLPRCTNGGRGHLSRPWTPDTSTRGARSACTQSRSRRASAVRPLA